MKNKIINLPDLEITDSPESFILKQTGLGKKIICHMVADKFGIAPDSATRIMKSMESKGLLKSSIKYVTSKHRRMRVFEK